MSDISSHDAHFLQKLPHALNSGVHQLDFNCGLLNGRDEATSVGFVRIDVCCAVECTVQ